MTVTAEPVAVFAGVDSHADTIHVAVIDARGGELADRQYATTPAGYRAALGFIASHGGIDTVGVEGTSSYGAGFSAAARRAGVRVIEVNRPDRSERRRRGKSDPIDAYAAARAVWSGRATSAPKDASVEAIRALHNASRSAIKARTAAMNQLHQMLINAPAELREKYTAGAGQRLVEALATARIPTDPITGPVTIALRVLARRITALTVEHKELRAHLDALTTQTNPGLRHVYGVGPDTAAQLLITAGNNPDRLRSEASFAALCGTAPVPASSGKTIRTASPAAATEPRTTPCTASRWSACPAIHKPRSTPRVNVLPAAPAWRSCASSSAPSSARSSAPSPATRPSPPSPTCAHPPGQEHHPDRRRPPLRPLPSAVSALERGLRRDDALTAAYRAWLQTA